MRFTEDEIAKALNDTKSLLPIGCPEELQNACKIDSATIDPAWPIHTNLEAVHYLLAWNLLCGTKTTVADEVYRLTHSHAGEFEDLAKTDSQRVYAESIYTKYVSVSWHTAGRYSYDDELVKALIGRDCSKMSMVDFGAAPWIQAIFYARKGFNVTVVNKSLESDCHLFGKFLATIHGVADRIIERASDDERWWTEKKYDVAYCVDVLEHIPPEADGTPGWIRFAKRLADSLKPDGIFYQNAPLDIEPGVPHRVSYHPVHFTSPISLQDWSKEQGFASEGCFLWRRA